MDLYDAHGHYADRDLQQSWPKISGTLDDIGLRHAVVNGTSPTNWSHVLELAKTDKRILPAIGLHPWKVNEAPHDWQTQFIEKLNDGVRIIGEVGLDRWIEDYDLEAQQAAFRWQLSQATERNLPISIHCLRAIGPLLNTLRNQPLPVRGFHLHAYNGPTELIPELVELGAYFSFNAGQLKVGSTKMPARIRAVPESRLLIETDAPNMLPIREHRTFDLPESQLSHSITHPATLLNGYAAVAEIRMMPIELLAQQVAINFKTYFLSF